MARAADEIAQSGDVRSIGSDAACVYRQPEAFGEIQVHTGVIQFRKTEAGSRLHAVHP